LSRYIQAGDDTAIAEVHALSATSHSAQSFDYADKGLKIMRDLVASAPENRQQQGYLPAVLATNGSTLIDLGKSDSALTELAEARSGGCAVSVRHGDVDCSQSSSSVRACGGCAQSDRVVVGTAA
jgi:hypothetical protein